ncbi:MAG: bifunctional UDP-3-O-[3-hydroxymyristoyl] N-acetylglucosamine deacetylase/3-hydroxyacyl-ACP dehydratase [Flavobacteriaceae bacterium]|nr:bifunctional UDP-3-O-[3-hydroxymyristoyl] N-acetylglucosamine deacetylase/3-hydroxyacyl-ACP dehydratase [Flavobacteriaceae bacterium]MCY4268515.1 bifunctional UDP-3-O-[3-hydroxymyristoyl] N-acetylglucosamine deacetylase/3-hydroxyacyl-ACP dehydratase [Flavobacteriaceae bacterium]MCY4299493.1 bifunctional UDP-3-O-[3-hydroxymyristoyl] N-acetylglucosamine deacetylase/3-hydroxyacyl-ACP dehydratase [Flavobacteriaceae bacterium]
MLQKTVPQQTLSNEISLKGKGLHTGHDVTITFKPAPVNTGIVFVRVDVHPIVKIPATVKFLESTDRRTTIAKDGVKINTIEHVMSSLVGLSVDNCFIELNGPEVPIMEGSSQTFVEALKNSGVQVQSELREEYMVTKPIEISDSKTGSEILVVPSDETSINVMVDFGTSVLGTQNARLEKIEDFAAEIAPCRTFSFLHDLQSMLNKGLIKGGDLNNAIVYVDKPVTENNLKKLHKVFGRKDIKVEPNGILNNLELHHPNEAARHKLLDLLGDLSLIGLPIRGKIIASKPGHHINTKMAQKIASVIQKERRLKMPNFNLNAKPLMDVNQITEMLPHRPPFLFVDKIFELTSTHVVGTKNVTINEPFFQGHFPGAPVLPGVLQIEGMAQTGGVLVMNNYENPQDYITFFAKIESARFKRPVFPGDTMIFSLELLRPIRAGISHMGGRIFVNGQVTTEAELLAKIVHRDKAPQP